jgi:hypothetical protein
MLARHGQLTALTRRCLSLSLYISQSRAGDVHDLEPIAQAVLARGVELTTRLVEEDPSLLYARVGHTPGVMYDWRSDLVFGLTPLEITAFAR